MTLKPAGNTQSKSSSRKAREFANREREILRVALDCFSGDNWESVTVAKIADLAGIAKGTMYLHFSSKHEMYARLTLNFYQGLLDHLAQCADHSPRDHLRYLVEQAFLYYLKKPKYRCVTQYCEREDFRRKLDADLAQEFEAIDRSFYQLIYSELQRGIDGGRFKPVKIEQAILGLQCTFHGALTLLWCDRNGEQDNPRQFINNITEYMIAPLLASGLCEGNKQLNNSKPSITNNKRPTLENTHE